MEWLVVELATYASSIAHAVVSFVAWLAVIVFAAMVLVYNRLAKQLESMLQVEPVRAENQNDRNQSDPQKEVA